MKKLFVLTLFLFVSLILVMESSVAAEDWKLLSVSDVKDNPALVHLVWEVQRAPYGAFDKITLHRVVKKTSMLFNKKTIFMIPGTWNAGGWSEITDPNLNTMLYLANGGCDVYTMDFRCTNIPDMDYDQYAANGIDISGTTDWNYGIFREDMKLCVDQIKKVSMVDKVFMSGFSRGGILIFIYASKYQSDLKGLVVLDSYIKDYPPSGTQVDVNTYNYYVALFKAGRLPNPQTGLIMPWIDGVFLLNAANYSNWKLADVLPYARNLVGGPLPTGFNVLSDYVADNAHHIWAPIWGDGALANYNGGNIDRDVLVKALNEFSRYYPNIQVLEDLQMAAYGDVPYFDYDDNPVDLPAIAFLTTYIGCPGGTCLISALPNRTVNSDVTINVLQGYGHMDVLFGKNSLTDVKVPLLNWLISHTASSFPYGDSNQIPTADAQAVKNIVNNFFKIRY